jgi:uncharacterized protein YoxC
VEVGIMNKRNMLLFIVIALLITIIVLIGISNESAQNLDMKRFTLSQLQEDFDKIKTTLEDSHPNYTPI